MCPVQTEPTTSKTGNRKREGCQALDTFIFTSSPARSWRLELPNEEYPIAVSVEGAAFAQGPQRIVIEAITTINGLTTPPGAFATAAKCVPVGDGAATLTTGGLAGTTARDGGEARRGARGGS